LPASRQGRGAAILAFLLQMALNAAWSFAFFAAHSPLAGLIVIFALDAAVVATIIVFARLDRVASYCLWPYAAWVTFATYLNAALWTLNR
jgi:benzodiazapine receptor